MKYYAPYGSLDANAPYVDRSTPDSQSGSKVPAKAIEHPQREIVAVIQAAGLVPSEGSTSQLLEALQFFFNQFPIYPECKNSNGTFDVSTPSAGTIRIPAGITWVMRGAVPYTSEQTDLATLANKTYHLRWDKANGFRLRDLADTAPGGYNPTAAAETNAGFDSSYDDVLVARVVTNGANVATITNLINKARLATLQSRRIVLPSALNWIVKTGTSMALNWARTPERAGASLCEIRCVNSGPDGTITDPTKGIMRNVGVRVSLSAPPTRYQVNDFEYYYEDSQVGTANEDGLASVLLNAEAA